MGAEHFSFTGVKVTNTNANPVPVSDAGGSLTVDGSVALTNQIPAVETGLAKEVTLQAVEDAVDGVESKLDDLLTELQSKTEPANQQHVLLDNQNPAVETGLAKDSTLDSILSELEFARVLVSTLSFVQVLTPLQTFTTSWVDITNTNWLDVHVEVETADAFDAFIEFTNASDPNVTPPGANDIVRSLDNRIGGTTLGGPANVLSFGIPAQMKWVRYKLTDITGGQTVKVSTFEQDIPPPGAQLPISAEISKEFRAPLTRSIILRDSSGFTSDSSGNNRSGKLIGTTLPAVISSPFLNGGPGAFQFNGVDLGANSSGIDCGVTGFGVATGNTSMIIRGKIKREAVGAGLVQFIACKWGASSSTQNYSLYITGDKLRFAMRNSGGTAIEAVGTTTLAQGTLYNVEGGWTGTTLYVKVNGISEGTTPALTTLQAPDSVTPFIIGKASGASPGAFTGVIDEIEVIVASLYVALYHLDSAGSPINIGQRTMSESISVTMATDQLRIPVRAALEIPSITLNATHKNIVQVPTTTASGSGVTAYTVTAGKTLYILTLSFTARNSDATSPGDIRLRDGTAGTNKISMALPTFVAGSIPQIGNKDMTFIEPLQFTSSVRFEVITGNITYDCTLVGYEI